MQIRPPVMVASAVLLVAGVSLAFYYGSSGSGVRYRLAKVERGDIVSTVSASGTVNAVITVQVGSEVSGTVREIVVDFNSQVKKGQLLARLDPEIFQAKVNQAQADLENAHAAVVNQQAALEKSRADLEAAKANVARAKVTVADAKIKRDTRAALFQEGGISQEERDSSQAAFESAQAQLEAAQAALAAAEAQFRVVQAQLESAQAAVRQKEATLRVAQVDLERTVIRAPVSGTVISRNVDVGQTVAASLQAPTLFTIAADLTKMQVDTNIDEADVSRVHLNQQATFTVDSYPGEIFRGKVVQIRQAPQIVQNVVTYDAVVAVQNPDLKLKPGMTANVTLLVERKENVLKIPNAALRFRPPSAREEGRRAAGAASGRGGKAGRSQTEQRVWILDGAEIPTPVTVKAGISDGTFTEIVTSSLKEGDEVLVGQESRNERPSRSGPPGPRF